MRKKILAKQHYEGIHIQRKRAIIKLIDAVFKKNCSKYVYGKISIVITGGKVMK